MAPMTWRRRLLAGTVAILLTVAAWEAMAKLISGMRLSDTQPMLCVYFVHSGYCVFIFVPLKGRILSKLVALGWIAPRWHPSYEYPPPPSSGDGATNDSDTTPPVAQPPMDMRVLWSRRMLVGSFLLAISWTIAAYLWFISLHMTLVSVNNAVRGHTLLPDPFTRPNPPYYSCVARCTVHAAEGS